MNPEVICHVYDSDKGSFNLIFFYIVSLVFSFIPPSLIVYSFPPKRSPEICGNAALQTRRGAEVKASLLHPHIQSVLPKRAATDDFLRGGILDLIFPVPRLAGDVGRGG